MTLQAQIKWVTNIADFKKEIEAGTSGIVAHTATVDRLTRSLSGQGLFAAVNNVVAAIDKNGGVLKLTGAELERYNNLVTKAIEKAEAMGRTVPEAWTKLQTATTRLNYTVEPLPAKFEKVAESQTLAQKASGFLNSSMTRLASSFAIGGLIESAITAVFSWGRAALDSAGKLVALSDQTGLSIRTVQEFGFVAQQTGTSVEAFTNAAFTLGTKLAGGSGSVVDAVNALGLSYRELRTSSPDDQFHAVVRALEAMEDPQRRNQLAVELFGKAAKDILPAIASGYSEIAGKARIASDEQVRALERQGAAWDRFKTNIGTSFIQAVGGVLMGVEKLTGSVKEVPKVVKPAEESFVSYQYELARTQTAVGKLTDWQKTEITTAQKLGVSTDDIANKFGVSQAALRLLTDETQKHEAALKKTNATSEAHAKVLEENRRALIPLTAEQKMFAVANDNLNRGVEVTALKFGISAKAVRTYLDTLKDNAKIAEAVNKAMTVLALESLPGVTTAIGVNAKAWSDDIRATEDYTLKLLELTEHGTDGIIAGINRRQAEHQRALDKSADRESSYHKDAVDAANAYYQHLRDIALGTAGTLEDRMEEQGVFTKGSLQDMADAAQRDYLQMAAHSERWGAAAVEHQKKVAEAAQRAATGTSTSWDRTYSALGKVGDVLGLIPGKMAAIATEAVNTAQVVMDKLASGDTWGAVIAAAAGAVKAIAGIWSAFFGTAGRDAIKEWAQSITNSPDLNALQKLLQERLPDSWEKYWKMATQGVGRNNPEQARKVIEEINAALAAQDAWMQRLPGVIEKYGLSWEDAGLKAKQAHLDEIARGLIQDFADLSAAGFDVTLITERMGDAINEYVHLAMRTGTEIPAAMRPLLEKMIEMGTLTDLAGEAMTDLEGLSFAETLTEGFKSVVDAIRELARALGALPTRVVIDVEERHRRTGDTGDPDPSGADQSRYHAGTARVLRFPIIAHNGLLPDEVPAILQTGEAVLNRRAAAAVGTQTIGALNRGDRPAGGADPRVDELRRELAIQRADSDARFERLMALLPKLAKSAAQQGRAA